MGWRSTPPTTTSSTAFSPVTNHRTDEYGGSLENRTRILREVVEAIRAACGRDFPLMFRISLEEYIGREGYHADTGIQICQMLASWGVDAINVTASGTDSKLSQSVEPMYYPQGWRKHLPKAVKRTVPLPVVSVALIRDPAYGGKAAGGGGAGLCRLRPQPPGRPGLGKQGAAGPGGGDPPPASPVWPALASTSRQGTSPAR